MHVLDFEKPIIELEKRLLEMRQFDADDPATDLGDAIAALEGKIQNLRQNLYKNLTRWQRVQIARHPDRPYSLDFIQGMTRNFTELHGDRLFADDPAIVGGFATFNGSKYGDRDRTVMVIGQQKGRDTKSRKFRRFGMPNPEGYRKALRLMRMAAKFNKPIITLLDTPGAYPGIEAEERGQAEAIARNLLEMARFPVPIVVVVIGEGASGGALGIGVGDKILMLENAWYSVISPESCSSILWRSWDHKEDAARALKLTAPDLIKVNIINEVIQEPLGGAHRDPAGAFKFTGHAIANALTELSKLPAQELLAQRLANFDAMGAFEEV
ncbi:MAG: acetyl-CoA carboxylase carboxyltransferase subunit alpha [Rhodothermia bacterium]|nr:acetyl-CoA carboxylase carboxyltransferase subunit alpha [Rhodothermia bacterium]